MRVAYAAIGQSVCCNTSTCSLYTPAPANSCVVLQVAELNDQVLQLKGSLCACVTELVRVDTNAQAVVQSNGIYIVAQFLLPQFTRDAKLQRNLQVSSCGSPARSLY